MAGYKTPDFTERAALARAAKQRALDQLRDKPAPDAATVAARQAAAAAREAAQAARRAARQAAAEEAAAAKAEAAAAAAALAVIEDSVAAEPAPPERPKPSAAELKAARDARYAARKARKR